MSKVSKIEAIKRALQPINKAPKIIILRYCDGEPEPVPPPENAIIIIRHIVSNPVHL